MCIREFLNISGHLSLGLAILFSLAPVFGLAQHNKNGHQHDQGSESSVEHWLPRLEGEERDSWQRPEEVVELLAISPGMVVADIGAGTGYFLGILAAAVGPEGQVLGLDVDDELVTYMQQRVVGEGWKNVESKKVAFDDPDLTPESVDRILIVNTWHHIGQREAYSGKLAAALANDGRVVIIDFTKDSPHGPPVDHRLSAAEVQSELEAAGFETEVVVEGLPHQYVVVARNPSS